MPAPLLFKRSAALRYAVLASLLLPLVLGAVQTARAAGVVGNGTPASCTEAALNAALAGGGRVSFNCGGPATILVLSQKNITQDTAIDGGGQITLTGGLATRLFLVFAPASLTLNNITLDSAYSANGSDGGAIASSGPLTLTNVTIQNSQTTAQTCGGAVRADGVTTITNSTFRNNTAGYGGALCTVLGTPRLSIAGSTFSGNKAISTTSGTGGAIHLGNNAQLTFSGGTLTGNSGRLGGAIYLPPSASASVTGGGQPVSITDNSAGDTGGAIWNGGTLEVRRATFVGNKTPTNVVAVGYGGAVANLGTMTLADSLLRLNQARFGGAVFAGGSLTSAQATIEHTVFLENSAAQFGGGLYTNNETATVTVRDTRFNGNSAAAGGGLARFSSRLSLLDSSVAQNTAATGGGLYLSAGPQPTAGGYVRVQSVTLSGNQATGGQGGAVRNEGQAELYNTTIVGNSGGVFSSNNGNTRLRNSVLHNPGSLNCDGDGTAQLSDDARNFSTDNSCVLPSSQTGPGLDPKLGPLTTDALGITAYHMPLPGSPLIDAGFNCPERDQRGASRAGACDIGAVEYGGLLRQASLPLVTR